MLPGWLLLRVVPALLRAHPRIALECCFVSQTRNAPQGVQFPSRLQEAYCTGIAQHGGTHGLVADPRPLPEPAKQERDAITRQGSIPLREEEVIVLDTPALRTPSWTVSLQVREHLVPTVGRER